MGKKKKGGKKCFAIAVVLAMLAIPAWGILDDNSTNYDQSQGQTALGGSAFQGQGQEQGQLQGQLQGQGQIAAQGQGQLGIVSPSQDVNVGGDSQKNYAYVMEAPNTVAGDGQTAMAAYSIFGGVNVAESSEYKVCIEKIRLIDQMKAAGLITSEQAIERADKVVSELDEATKPRRLLWIGPKTRGKHLGNALGLLAMDPCDEINTDNWFGLKGLFAKKEKV